MKGQRYLTKDEKIERFWSLVDKNAPNGCWNWTGSVWASGYGGAPHIGVVSAAHRVSWYLHNGKQPDGLMVCHKCNNKKCVNPDHLYLGTGSDNALDRWRLTREQKRAELGVNAWRG
jgi:hypothetical protein